MLCEHHCCTSEGLVVLRDHTNRICGVAATMYRREQGPRHFGRKLDSEDGREHLGEAYRKARRRPICAWGRPEAIHGVTRPGAWPLQGIPYEGLQRGLGGVCISLPYSLASAFTLQSWFMLYFPSLVIGYLIGLEPGCITPFCGRDSNTLANP